MGRPKLSEAEKKHRATICISISSLAKSIAIGLSEKHGMSVSKVIDFLIRDSVSKDFAGRDASPDNAAFIAVLTNEWQKTRTVLDSIQNVYSLSKDGAKTFLTRLMDQHGLCGMQNGDVKECRMFEARKLNGVIQFIKKEPL